VHLISGSIAGVVSRSITHPLERLRILQQVGNAEYVHRGVISSLLKLNRSEGIRGLWKGNAVNCTLAAPFSAFEFFFYEFFKEELFPGVQKQDLTFLQRFAAGGLSGAASQFLVYPGDVVKTHYVAATTKKMTSENTNLV
jgi:solute carrier family 25 (mitochondrial phosphate transporter), member 23/24/25/41